MYSSAFLTGRASTPEGGGGGGSASTIAATSGVVVVDHPARVEALAEVGRRRGAADLPGAGVAAALAEDPVHLLDRRVDGLRA